VIGTGVRLGLSRTDADLSRQLEEAQKSVAKLDEEQSKARVQLTTMKRRLDAARATGRHPNWGILMNLLADALNPRTALDALELTRTRVEAGKGESGAKAAMSEMSVNLKGRSQSVEGMGEFLAALERTKVFRQVKLGDNRRVDENGSSVIEFSVRCVLDSSDLTSAEVSK
jgi:Tfp pilus assembly protein PilN